MMWRVVERNAVVGRRHWLTHLAGGAEPFLYLFSVGVGVGALIDDLAGPTGELVSYRSFVAPGMMAAAAMNTVVFDTSINFFVRFKYIKTYEPMMATPIGPRDVVRGELAWTLTRVALYATAFIVTMLAMGLVASPWAVLAVPATVLVGLAFGCVGMAASTWMRSWLDFDLVFLAVVPMFFFSATFFPLERYPAGVQVVVQLTPLYHGADLIRRLILGGVGWAQLISVAYLLTMAAVALRVADRRVAVLLQP